MHRRFPLVLCHDILFEDIRGWKTTDNTCRRIFSFPSSNAQQRLAKVTQRLSCLLMSLIFLIFSWIPGQAWSSTSSSIPQRRWSPSCFQPRLLAYFFVYKNWEACDFPRITVDELIRCRSLALRSVCGVCLSLPFVGGWLHWCFGLQILGEGWRTTNNYITVEWLILSH